MAYRDAMPYRYGFGLDPADPLQVDLTETIRLVRSLAAIGVIAVNISCGSPYYNPHMQRPAAFPPSDGYQPPEDPLVGVARQIDAARRVKQAVPEVTTHGLFEGIPRSGVGCLRSRFGHAGCGVEV